MNDEFVDKVSALANGKRLQILEWLKKPSAYFGPEHPVNEAEGVCGLYIAEKLGVTPATASVHLKILTTAGFVQPHRVGKYTYFKRVETAFSDLVDALRSI